MPTPNPHFPENMSSLDNIINASPASEDVDLLADQFEKNWNPDSIDRLESILASVKSEEDRREVLEEILHTEFELRFQHGLPVEPEDYRTKFPQYAEPITEVWRQLMASRRFGVYEYFEILGQGGLGIVYRARHPMLDRIVAVKSLHSNLVDASDFVSRFLREIRLVSKLRHPNIVGAEYADSHNGRYYMAMEYIDGRDLNQIVKKYGPLSLGTACEIVKQAACGLQHALDQNIIHRDIKPGNIMVARDGLVKVLDFGLGKFQYALKQKDANHSMTTVGSTMGSVDYIAPEQWEDAASVTIKADIYSLGCTFFYLLTGKAPFEQENLSSNQKMIAHIKGEIPSLTQHCGHIPKAIDACYQKMIAKKPEDRFDQPIDIAQIVEQYANLNEYEQMVNLIRNIPPTGSEQSTTEIVFSHLNRNEILRLSPSGVRNTIKTKNAITLSRFATAALILFLTGIVLFVWSIGNHGPEQDQDIIPKKIDEATTEFVQFTGYSGKWWFQEVPWLLPVFREAICQTPGGLLTLLADEGKALSNKEENISETCSDWKILSRKWTADHIESRQEGLKPLINVLLSDSTTATPWQPLAVEWLKSATDPNTATPTELHTQAVLWHALSDGPKYPEATDRARELYEKALAGYAAQGNALSDSLENLCRFDLAWLNFQLYEDADELQRKLLEIVSETNSLPFQLELVLVPVERQMETGAHRNKAFEEAIERLNKDGRKSPLRPWLHRRYAAALTKQWRLGEAEPHWEKALECFFETSSGKSVREIAGRSTDHAEFYFYCRLAQVFAERYQGNLAAARRRCRDLTEDIRDFLAVDSGTETETKTDSNKPRCRLLENALARTLESLADCTLYSPIYFGKHPPRSTGFFVEEAEELYREAEKLTHENDRGFVLHCKRALLTFNCGDFRKASACWSEAKRLNQQLPEMARTRRTEDFYGLGNALFSCAEKVVTASGTEPQDMREFGDIYQPDTKMLRGLLDHFRLNNNAFDRYAGEKLDLQLFCIRLLLERGDVEKNEERQLVRNDIERYLAPILLEHLQHECRTRPFLYDYYDLALRLRDEEDMIKTVEYIRTARCQRRSSTILGTRLIFYFSPAGGNGFAIFLPPEMQNPQHFALEMTRQDLLQENRLDKLLRLPQKLVDQVNSVLETSGWLELSWDDSPCWRHEADRLTLQYWPFDEQLNRKRLVGFVK